ncbi:hypothetical protein KFU94_32920 [Chloroflexi bacterium TSY]|nr:hypothetical protein [Chloroflexi bacterium TSY]
MASSTTNTKTLPLIYTKLNRPRIADNLIPRARLLTRLQASLSKKLTLISAPAGFGKTMLACMWLEECQSPTAWLSLGEDDGNIDRFLCYLAAAIETVFPDACAQVDNLLPYEQLPTVDEIVVALINDLARLPLNSPTERFILVLDDYHRIQNEAIHQLLSKLIEYQPQHLHLLLISRQDPMSLPLSRLRAGGEMTEIRLADLRFKADEAKSFLTKSLDMRLSDESLSLLGQRLEGWVVGLQLVALSMRGIDDPAAFIANLQGGNHYITEYLVDEVLAQQTTAVQAFMLQISILNRFSESLCEAVTGVQTLADNGQTYLEWLEQTNLFLISLDRQHMWYRFHHLFQELLISKLEVEYSISEITALHYRASQWYADHDYVEEAIYHAQAAQNVDLAVQLVETRCQQFLSQGRVNLERWLALLPQEVIQKRPKLLMAQAWRLYFHWRISRLKTVLDQVEVALQDEESTLAPAEHQAIQAQYQTLRCVTTYILDNDFSGTVAWARCALSLLPNAESGARNIALGFLSIAQQALGDPERDLSRLKECLQTSSVDSPATFQSFVSLCVIQLVAGENYQLQQTITRYLGHAPSNSLRGAGTSWIAGLLDYEWNRLEEAKTHFANIFAIEERHETNFIAAFNGTLGLVRLLQLEGKWEQAQETLHILHTDTVRLQNSDFMPLLEATQAYQWHLQGDAISAMQWVYASQITKLPDSIFFFSSSKSRVQIFHANRGLL